MRNSKILLAIRFYPEKEELAWIPVNANYQQVSLIAKYSPPLTFKNDHWIILDSTEPKKHSSPFSEMDLWQAWAKTPQETQDLDLPSGEW